MKKAVKNMKKKKDWQTKAMKKNIKSRIKEFWELCLL